MFEFNLSAICRRFILSFINIPFTIVIFYKFKYQNKSGNTCCYCYCGNTCCIDSDLIIPRDSSFIPQVHYIGFLWKYWYLAFIIIEISAAVLIICVWFSSNRILCIVQTIFMVITNILWDWRVGASFVYTAPIGFLMLETDDMPAKQSFTLTISTDYSIKITNFRNTLIFNACIIFMLKYHFKQPGLLNILWINKYVFKCHYPC